MPPLPYFHVNAFTAEPFAGNPAAVCVLEQPVETAWMQTVATELRLPVTAFVAREGEGWALRWFTVTEELEICGHATIASAHVLWETGAVAAAAAIEFATASGTIAAAREEASVFLTLPAGRVVEAQAPEALLAGLGTDVVATWRTPLDYLAELDGAERVAALTPDIARLAEVETRGVIVSAPGGDGVDFTSRFFAPRLSLDEDSVTGSAHASLAPFWAKRLGKTVLRARQASARGGYLDLRVRDDVAEVGGPAVTVARGEILVSLA
jgi:PhzF family phenazine biosynthesis protein